ncbi:PepSY-associated TM helix domain-containing protein [Microcoleus sp. herbarium19]|uniref:PepSY-associated TM helix domain-containing protein n=1 Tax=unclassified Microcoleus TaxID=2642155 RepID=UPI002FD15704
MNARKFRNIAFHAHRWLGLTAGILLCIAGITGSILVFWHEIDRWWLTQRFGAIIPSSAKAAIPAIVDRVKTTYANKNLTLTSLSFPHYADDPYQAWLKDAADRHLQVFVNPYNGQIMGDRQWEISWVGWIYELHYKLLAGDTGVLIVGIVALLTLILSVTGIVLWPGWRRLATGFKIKWHGHIKRLNFDLHKVFGIIAAVFLAFIGFTGFAWNVPQAKVTEAIYAVTLTAKPADPVSKPIPGKQPLAIGDLLRRADAAVPNAKTTYISFPNKPEEVFQVGKRQSQESDKYGNTRIYLDRFTGKIIQLKDGVKPSRAEAILNQFGPVHFGTFGGRLTQILYVFVGLAPSILFVTGFIMWWHRRRVKRDRDIAV